jgi:hypothetical protein
VAGQLVMIAHPQVKTRDDEVHAQSLSVTGQQAGGRSAARLPDAQANRLSHRMITVKERRSRITSPETSTNPGVSDQIAWLSLILVTATLTPVLATVLTEEELP